MAKCGEKTAIKSDWIMRRDSSTGGLYGAGCYAARVDVVAYFSDATELVNHAKQAIPKLKQAYEESLNEQTIKPVLLIEIKNLMENLRSALDFSCTRTVRFVWGVTKCKATNLFSIRDAEPNTGTISIGESN